MKHLVNFTVWNMPQWSKIWTWKTAQTQKTVFNTNPHSPPLPTHTCTRVHTHTHTHMHTRAHTHTHTHTSMHAHTHTHTHTHKHAHTHTHTHTNTHIYNTTQHNTCMHICFLSHQSLKTFDADLHCILLGQVPTTQWHLEKPGLRGV